MYTYFVKNKYNGVINNRLSSIKIYYIRIKFLEEVKRKYKFKEKKEWYKNLQLLKKIQFIYMCKLGLLKPPHIYTFAYGRIPSL